jgi:hypothetical protein
MTDVGVVEVVVKRKTPMNPTKFKARRFVHNTMATATSVLLINKDRWAENQMEKGRSQKGHGWGKSHFLY